ncbi:pseudouridine synthase [Rhizobium sp. FY34]|uniref:pseudouridine synthase n=1 Tax=Rhizobium sp. FY34 TaxID=2562309 RepID=UPI0010C13799|nr:pseudouridine synthase [Rhizobium sp. FY34]
MSFKDKPKREGGKPFDRERKKTTAPVGADGKPKVFRKAATETVSSSVPGAGKPERISKILARVGVASRRDIERMIMEGRVSLNGKQLETPVVNVTLADRIEVDGLPIRGIERTRLWLYHKPAGLVTTNSDPEGRATVFENLPEELPRVMSIGRLDINTEGLLLLTNDGGLSRVLELPTTGWLRRYRVRAYGDISQEKLDTLKEGIAVDGVLYGAIDATLDRTQGHNVWISMGLREGKNREIKNVLGALGLDVNRLIRISYGPFQLGDLPEGHVVEVRGRMLRDQLGPRLIEESKANFDAPIYNNGGASDDEDKPAPKAGGREERAEGGWGAERRQTAPERGEGRRLDRRDGERPAAKSGEKPRFGDKPKFGDKKFGDKPKFGDKGKFAPRGGAGGFDEDKPKKRPPMGTSRTANVWMAPGARPTADGKANPSARAEAERLFAKGTDDASLRVQVNRVQGDSDWIRADEPAERSPRNGEGFGKGARGDRPDRGDRGDRPARSDRPERAAGGRPDRGDRPPRGDRPARSEGGDRNFSDRPRGDRKPREDGDRGRSKPYGAGSGPGRSPRENAERVFSRPAGARAEGSRSEGGRPERARPEGGRPEGGRGFGAKPGGARPYSGRPAGERSGERSEGGRPERARPEGGRPEGARSGFGAKPSGGKPFGKPPGGKPFGGKPSGEKSFGGKPSGGKSFGGKPGGGRGPGSGPKGGGNRSRTPRG